MRSKLGCFIFLMITVTSLIFAGTVYYVDANNGNDLYDGFTPATAWQTIAKVNGSSFSPGDSILFKCGEVWREQLTIPSSGSAGNPITFGAFGSGPKPVISGADSLTSWTHVSGTIYLKSRITLEPYQVFFDGTKGNKQTAIEDVDSANDWYWASNILYIYSTSDPDETYFEPGIEAGVRTMGITSNAKAYITIDGLCVTHSNGTDLVSAIDVRSGSATNWIIQNCDITYNGNIGILMLNYASSFTVDNNTITYNGGSGIAYHEHQTGGIISNNTIVYNEGIGLWLWGDGSTSNNNTIHHNSLNGIYIHHTASSNTIQFNNIYTNGQASSFGCNTQKLEIYSYGGNSNNYYYNVIHDGSTTNNTGSTGIYLDHGSESNKIYNNTIYNFPVIAPGTQGHGIVLEDGSGFETINNIIKNNLISNCGSQVTFADDIGADNPQGNVFDNNCYYVGDGDMVAYAGGSKTLAQWQAMTGNPDPNSISSDPLMTAPANDDFTLQVGSPCINAGINVSLTQDYAGNTVPYGLGIDIGAYEYIDPSPLYAEINASPTSGWIPLTVNFTGSASGGTEPYTYSWDFGDGGSSREQNPFHTYSEAGDYTVILTVTDSEDNHDTDSLIIHASELTDPLEASVTASPTSGEVPLTVSFTGNATGGTPPYSYSWNFGDGGSSSKQNPSHSYYAVGNYIVILTVTDSNSNQASDSLTINAYVNPTYQLAVSAATGSPAPGAGGTTNPSSGNHSYSVGNSVQVKAIPNENYRFSKWTGDVSDSETYNEEVNITMDKNKSISAYFFTKCGDVTGDLSITPGDAQAVFDIYLGKISNPTESEKENADVNCSGTKTEPDITPGDAQAIFEKFLGINELPCDCSCNSRNDSVISLMPLIPMRHASDVNLIVNDVRVDHGGEVVVPIVVDDPFNIKAFGFDLIFPSEILEFVGVERSELMEDFYQVDANKIAEGVVRAGGYRREAIKSHDPRVLITLVFKVIGEVEGGGISSFSIVNTFDDIKNASFKNERVIERVREPRHIRRKKARIK